MSSEDGDDRSMRGQLDLRERRLRSRLLSQRRLPDGGGHLLHRLGADQQRPFGLQVVRSVHAVIGNVLYEDGLATGDVVRFIASDKSAAKIEAALASAKTPRNP